MNIRKITPTFFVSEQLSELDIDVVAAQGIKTIMCNRPDDEKPGQPLASEISAAAKARGLSFVELPVKSGAITDENITDFARAFADAEEPILAYCRSGMRSAMLWALAEASSTGVDAVLSATKAAGYDLEKMQPRLLQLSSN